MNHDPSPPIHTTPVALSCPYCGASIALGDAVPIEGATLPCLACGERPVLVREWVGHTRGFHWDLVEAGDADEPE